MEFQYQIHSVNDSVLGNLLRVKEQLLSEYDVGISVENIS